MPREPRIYTEKALYLVTAKGDEDHHLFNDSQDFNEYLQFLSEYKREYGFRLFAFALLPKRLCLLIELKNNVTVSTIMHNLNSKYTKTYNSRYGKKGHLFQSRFKSILIEKDDYLLRLTRYIHRLPGDFSVTENPAEYPYSSYPVYISGSDCHCEPRQRRGEAISKDSHEIASLPEFTPSEVEGVARNDKVGILQHFQIPNMADEISEVLNHLSETGTDLDKQKAYEGYVRSADAGETATVRKLLHRTAFVGSKDFVEEMREKIQEHIIEEEKVRVVRRPNRVFVLTGSLVILFLSIVTYNFYNNQSRLQDALNVTTSGFEVARDDLTKRVNTLRGELTGLEKEIIGFEEKANHGLGEFAWKLQFRPVQDEPTNENYYDDLQFKGGKIISAKLLAKGFSPFDYTISRKTHGKLIWQTAQTNANGLTVRWYGIVTGDNMRGVLSEVPAQGKGRDFSFVTVNNPNIGVN